MSDITIANDANSQTSTFSANTLAGEGFLQAPEKVINISSTEGIDEARHLRQQAIDAGLTVDLF